MNFQRLASHVAVRTRIGLTRWRRQGLFLLGGVCVGAVAVGMAFLADHAQMAFRRLLEWSPLAAIIVTPIGFAIAALATRELFPNSQGSGIPQVIAARGLADPKARLALVSLRVAFGKILVMTFGLLCGASIGREGPTVQVGASIMYAMGRRALFWQRGLLLAGAAAGIAAAFNTPLAGIVFGIEEMSRSFEARTSGLVIAAVIAAGVTSFAIVGEYAYFGSTAAALGPGKAWLAIPVCAAIGGVAGAVFNRIVVLFATGLPGRVGLALKRNPVAFAMCCGLGVAVCGLASHGAIFGTGYEEARSIIHGSSQLETAFGPLKLVATSLSAISAIPGGVFAPSLAIGAGLGADVGSFFPYAPIGALAVIGMASYLTGVTHAPITSVVIVSEMTENHALVIPLLAAALMAKAVSKLLCRDGLYWSLSRPIRAKFNLQKSHIRIRDRA